jgi:tetratricopeptide (TPR) repeat protein
MQKKQETKVVERLGNKDPEIKKINARIAELEYAIAKSHWEKANEGEYKLYFIMAARMFLSLGKKREARLVIQESGLNADNVEEYIKGYYTHAAEIMDELGFKKTARKIMENGIRKDVASGKLYEAVAAYKKIGMNTEAIEIIKTMEDGLLTTKDIGNKISVLLDIQLSYEKLGERVKAENARTRKRTLEKQKYGNLPVKEKSRNGEIEKYEEQLKYEMERKQKDSRDLYVTLVHLRECRKLNREEKELLKVHCRQVTENFLYFCHAELIAECYIEIGEFDKAVARIEQNIVLHEMCIKNKKMAIAQGLSGITEGDLSDSYRDLIHNLTLLKKIKSGTVINH